MRIVAAYDHEKYGRVYLWNIRSYEYSVGSAQVTFSHFYNKSMEEVKEELSKIGYVEVPLY